MGNFLSSSPSSLLNIPKRSKGPKGKRVPSRKFLKRMFSSSNKDPDDRFVPNPKVETSETELDLDTVEATEVLVSVSKSRPRPPRKRKDPRQSKPNNDKIEDNEKSKDKPKKPPRPSLILESSNEEIEESMVTDNSPPPSDKELFLDSLNAKLSSHPPNYLQQQQSEQENYKENVETDTVDAIHKRFVQTASETADDDASQREGPPLAKDDKVKEKKKMFLKPGALFGKIKSPKGYVLASTVL